MKQKLQAWWQTADRATERVQTVILKRLNEKYNAFRLWVILVMNSKIEIIISPSLSKERY